MQPQNQTPNQQNPVQNSTNVYPVPPDEPTAIATTPAPTATTAATSVASPPVNAPPASVSDSQPLPTVTPASSPLATPPNIPPSQLKEYLANQANTQQSDSVQTESGGSSFELMIVSLQLVMILVILVDFFSPLLIRSTTVMVGGALLIGLGLAFAIWARASFKQHMKIFPSPSEKGFLVTGGPYSLVRHPVYTGVLLACLGLVLVYPTIIKSLAYIALVFIMLAKIKYEEKMLAKKYSGYTIYQQHTGKLFPKLSRN